MNERKHGHWKVHGHAATCSVCGSIGENAGYNYCSHCGSIMDEPEVFDIPSIPFPKLTHVTCTVCGSVMIVGAHVTRAFCPHCGTELEVKP